MCQFLKQSMAMIFKMTYRFWCFWFDVFYQARFKETTYFGKMFLFFLCVLWQKWTRGCVILNDMCLIFPYGQIMASELEGNMLVLKSCTWMVLVQLDTFWMKIELYCQEKILWKGFIFLIYLHCNIIVL